VQALHGRKATGKTPSPTTTTYRKTREEWRKKGGGDEEWLNSSIASKLTCAYALLAPVNNTRVVLSAAAIDCSVGGASDHYCQTVVTDLPGTKSDLKLSFYQQDTCGGITVRYPPQNSMAHNLIRVQVQENLLLCYAGGREAKLSPPLGGDTSGVRNEFWITAA